MYTTEIENYIESQLSQVKSENKKFYSFIAERMTTKFLQSLEWDRGFILGFDVDTTIHLEI